MACVTVPAVTATPPSYVQSSHSGCFVAKVNAFRPSRPDLPMNQSQSCSHSSLLTGRWYLSYLRLTHGPQGEAQVMGGPDVHNEAGMGIVLQFEPPLVNGTMYTPRQSYHVSFTGFAGLSMYVLSSDSLKKQSRHALGLTDLWAHPHSSRTSGCIQLCCCCRRCRSDPFLP